MKHLLFMVRSYLLTTCYAPIRHLRLRNSHSVCSEHFDFSVSIHGKKEAIDGCRTEEIVCQNFTRTMSAISPASIERTVTFADRCYRGTCAFNLWLQQRFGSWISTLHPKPVITLRWCHRNEAFNTKETCAVQNDQE